ncbi:MAG: ABC transporter ATP-binding protein [Methylobacteriaceae bacterium]|nr:ABC transporter ATP-binding protein [Methylobacteriaceae bacterium]
MSAPALLEVDGLFVHFEASRRPKPAVVHAVDGVSFRIPRGTTFGIVGESGSGKSTTAQAVMRLVPTTAGAIRLDGRNIIDLNGVALHEVRKSLQMIFQDPFSSLDPRRRAGNLIAEPIRLLEHRSKDETAARVDELLAAVGLQPSAASLFPHQFSGGQRQRLCIARALATAPALIVCDEAVSALDVAIQAQILNLLLRLQAERGLAYLFISHDLGVVQHMCDEIAVMYLGQIIEQAPNSAFFSRPHHPYTWSLMTAALPAGPLRQSLKKSYLATGEPPSPINPPNGCRFASRCPFVVTRCREEAPELVAIGTGHWVACHRHDEIDPPVFA